MGPTDVTASLGVRGSGYYSKVSLTQWMGLKARSPDGPWMQALKPLSESSTLRGRWLSLYLFHWLQSTHQDRLAPMKP